MTIPKTLFEEVCSLSNLEDAWRNLNKSNLLSCGCSGMTIDEYKKDIENHLRQISKQLKENNFHFSPTKAAIIPKDNYAKKKKFRPLQISEIEDRIVMKSMSIAIEEELKAVLTKGQGVSFAYQKGIGPRDAIEKIRDEYNKGRKVILKSDIQNFFNEIPAEKLLKSNIFPNLRDKSLNKLIENSLNQKVQGINLLKKKAHRELFDQHEKGVPQGNPISPLLSNIYLAPFDDYIKKKYSLVRYADDFIILCNSKEEASKAYNDASSFLKNELSLKIHDINANNDKTKIIDPIKEELTFLSVSFDGKNIYPKKRNIVVLKKKLRKLFWLHKKNNEIVEFLMDYLSSWVSNYTYTQIEKYYEEIDEFINRQLIKVLKFQGKIASSQMVLTHKNRDKFHIHSMNKITEDRRKKQRAKNKK